MADAVTQVVQLRERVAAADGLIAVTPVFNAAYSGLFKMFFDALDPDGLTGTPVLIAATAGTDLTGWTIVRYNGLTGAVYTTPAQIQGLSGIVGDDTGTGWGFATVTYPVNGLQNGGTGSTEPDGFALVDADGVGQIVGGLDRGIGGPLLSPAAYLMKSPPEQRPDDLGRQQVEAFIKGDVLV